MSILTKQNVRQSNIELLRIISMLFVLMLHANIALSFIPSFISQPDYNSTTCLQLFVESISIVAVNVFVLISGWFGIHPNLKRFGKFIFQVFFFLIGIHLIYVLFEWEDLSGQKLLKSFAACFFMHKVYWFVKSYIGLFILAPVLNNFIENGNEKSVRYFLISFFIFQTLYAWVVGSADFFINGYSTMSFIGLYVLARYVRLYPNRLSRLSPKSDFVIFLGGTLALMGASFIFSLLGTCVHPIFSNLIGKMYSYVNPIVIIMSVYLLLCFSKIKFNNNIVNWIAESCFAVYLLQEHFDLRNAVYFSNIQHIASGSNTVKNSLELVIYIAFVFVIAICIDKIRLKIWNQIIKITHVHRSRK